MVGFAGMRYALLVVACVAGVVCGQGYGPDPPGLSADAKCAWRKLILAKALEVRPDGHDLYVSSLQLGEHCPANDPEALALLAAGAAAAAANPNFPRVHPTPAAQETEVYVDAVNGDDSNPGTQAKPKQTIQAGVNATRSKPRPAILYLRQGTFYQSEAIQLHEADSGLTIQNFDGEEAWVSGGVLLNGITWSQHDVDPNNGRDGGSGNNIWKADLSAFNLGKVEGLRVSGRRVSPARYPNADPETQFWPTGYLTSTTQDWLKPKISPKPNPAKIVDVASPNRDWDSYFPRYSGGIGGTCSIYDPPFSFWCQDTYSKGCGGCFTWNIPSGFKFGKQLPKSYKNWQEGYFMAWRKAHWANWAFEIESYDPNNSTIEFGKGGFQGARGGAGSDWFVMNILDELDHPTEYFYDSTEKALYYFANNTEGKPPSATDEFVAVVQHTLFNVTGSSQQSPIKNVSLRGFGIRDTAWTMMQPHGVPSGGDWALERMGAVFFENTVGVVVDGLEATRLGGNGIMLSKYNWAALVQNSSFAWLGGSAIALWGWTDEITDGGIHGIDSTAGNFPRHTVIQNNLFREIGVWEKQSSAVFEAKAAESLITRNVVFNLARAGFNFNDGHGGGDNVTYNVLWNTCRESSDHGPINSWDRQPFVTTVFNGTASTMMKWRHVHHNLLIANYGGVKEVDNDDGSLFWRVHDNVMFFGWGQKFKCGGIESYNNLKAYIDLGGKFDAGCTLTPQAYFPNLWHNDVMTVLGDKPFMYRQCWGQSEGHDYDKTQVFNNTIYLNDNKQNAMISCGKKSYTLPEFQNKGEEPGSKQVQQTPSADQVIQWAQAVLGQW